MKALLLSFILICPVFAAADEDQFPPTTPSQKDSGMISLSLNRPWGEIAYDYCAAFLVTASVGTSLVGLFFAFTTPPK